MDGGRVICGGFAKVVDHRPCWSPSGVLYTCARFFPGMTHGMEERKVAAMLTVGRTLEMINAGRPLLPKMFLSQQPVQRLTFGTDSNTTIEPEHIAHHGTQYPGLEDP